MIRGLVFDLDDTLCDDTSSYHAAALDAARELAREHTIDPIVLKEAYIREADGFWQRLTPEELGKSIGGLRERMWAAALADVGITDCAVARHAAELYNAARKGNLALFPSVDQQLEHWRASYRLALLTNGFSETHREKIALLEIEPYFDAILIADEVGMVKPDPRVFLHACRRIGTVPQQTVMVGDRYERDIVGAIEAGLRTIWVNVRGESLPAGRPRPDAVIGAIAELDAELARLPA
ncbi:HAD family hydrolase [bacterium]|nr:MAG: HAD family hydrolase [bacterium]